MVSVDVVGGLEGRALRERLRDGHDGATRLRNGKKGETSRDGCYTWRKLQLVAEDIDSGQKERVLGSRTRLDLVWRETGKS